MPTCPMLQSGAKIDSDQPRGIATWGIIDPNGAGTGGLDASMVAYPATVYDVALIVQKEGGRLNERVRAYGSLDSFTDAAFPLAASSPLATPNGDICVDTTKLRGSLQCLLSSIVRSGVDTGEYFFVEAGIKLSDLNTLLDLQSPSRALATMGGSSTQSLAGAISTGTHGMDFDRPPLADSVIALYIVGAGGTHYWIEGSMPRTDPVKLTAMFPCLLAANIYYSDQMLHDVMVSFGSMGVIYAAIIQTVPQYELMQMTRDSTWETVSGAVAAGGSGLDIANAVIAAITGVGTPDNTLRALQIVINPIKTEAGTHNCYVTCRSQGQWSSGLIGSTSANLGTISASDLQNFIGSDPSFDLNAKIRLGNFLGNEQNLGLPGKNGLIQFVMDFVEFCQQNGMAWAIRDAIDGLMSEVYPPYDPGDYGNYPPQIDTGYKIMANGAFATAFPFGALASTEAFFDVPTAASYIGNLLAEMDSLVDQAIYPAGYISLRLCGQTQATLGQQKVGPTGCVETALLATDAAVQVIRSAEEFCGVAGGILHWGQSNGLLFASNIANYYGASSVAQWKKTQQLLGGKTFSNWYMERLGLV